MSAKCRDKFLVQSTIITPDRENTQISDLWGLVEQEDKSAIHEQKIRCAFLPPATAPVPEEEEDTTNGDEKYSTVRGGAPNGGAETYNPVTAASNAASRTDGTTTDKARTAVAAAGGAAAAGAGAAYAATRSAVVGNGSNNSTAAASKGTSSSAPASSDSKGNSELQAEVNRLRAQVAELKKSGGQTATATDAGVPVHIVAAIAFGVFAVTYLFF